MIADQVKPTHSQVYVSDIRPPQLVQRGGIDFRKNVDTLRSKEFALKSTDDALLR